MFVDFFFKLSVSWDLFEDVLPSQFAHMGDIYNNTSSISMSIYINKNITNWKQYMKINKCLHQNIKAVAQKKG